jgi:hypothetical protein
MSIPMHQLGWMAGVLDMKGAIFTKKNKQRATPQLVLAVESKQIQVIRELSRMTGTSPELQQGKKIEEWMRRGCTIHCPEQHIHVGSPGHPDYAKTMPPVARWTITGAAMAVVLYHTIPFIRNDKGFTEAMNNAFTDIVPSGQGRGAVDRALNRLKELDWEIPDLCYPATDEKLDEKLKLVHNAS